MYLEQDSEYYNSKEILGNPPNKCRVCSITCCMECSNTWFKKEDTCPQCRQSTLYPIIPKYTFSENLKKFINYSCEDPSNYGYESWWGYEQSNKFVITNMLK